MKPGRVPTNHEAADTARGSPESQNMITASTAVAATSINSTHLAVSIVSVGQFKIFLGDYGKSPAIKKQQEQWRQEQNLHGLVSREASLLVPHGELSSETNTRAGESM